MIKSQTLKGFRDFLPEQMIVRKFVMNVLTDVFESYGFEPLETPAVESAQTLLGKSGEEAEKLMYLFKDPGGRDVGLRYELTVSLARVLAQYHSLPLPFKRYQLQPVWRAENTQRGRYREFYQCDIDTIGSASPLADAEIIAVIHDVLTRLGFAKFTIHINSRKVLFHLLERAAVPEQMHLIVLRAIDKLNKIGREGVEKELASKGLATNSIKTVFDHLEKAVPDEELTSIFSALTTLGVSADRYQFTPHMVRGLDYYTGPIFESDVTEPKIGSLTGGGRWDTLIGKFTGNEVPATGTSFGFERIVEVVEALGLMPQQPKTITTVLVTVFSPNLLTQSLSIAHVLRSKRINAELYLDTKDRLDKQLKYADRKGIPFAVIQGPEERSKNVVKLKDLRSKLQEDLTVEEVVDKLSDRCTGCCNDYC